VPPPLVVINGVVRIDTTPVPDLPVVVGESQVNTDQSGEFSLEISSAAVADISSGLLAVRYDKINGVDRETLEGSGAEIAAIADENGGSIVIDATQRIKPGPLCYVPGSEAGSGTIRFPFTNRYGATLRVESDKLNALTSLADPSRGPDEEPYPLADFESTDIDKPDNYLGFEWSVNYFSWFDSARNTEIISAQWRLINEIVSLDQPLSEVPLCPEPGLFQGCAPYTSELSNRLYAQMFSTVTNLSKQAQAAAKKGRWRNRDGRFRNPFYDQAAKSLRNARRLLSRIGNPAYVCIDAAPAGCSAITYPKAELLEQFDRILRVKLPKELRFLNRAIAPERVKFVKLLRQQPNTVVNCQR
jgi:hypothetical protein